MDQTALRFVPVNDSGAAVMLPMMLSMLVKPPVIAVGEPAKPSVAPRPVSVRFTAVL